MATVLLVDGSSYLYRAFHALPDLRTKAGEPTGAVRGVLSMLKKLEHDYPADYRVCIFDAKGKTFREDLYTDYKANRPSMPDDLCRQIDVLCETVRASGWPLLSVEGIEADDVIGTLTREAVAKGWRVIISTGDKDLTQLVREGVTWVNTMSNEVLDTQGVKEKFGVLPEQMIDYLALVGDAVDNVPGVAKCGPKTAVKWLMEYGSLDNLVNHAAAIGGRIGENLRAHLDFLPLGKQLVTVKTDAGLPLCVEQLVPVPVDHDALIRLYRRLEFKSWLQQLEQGVGTAAGLAETAEGDTVASGSHRSRYETITEWETFDRWLEKITAADSVAVDTETTSLDPLRARLVGISFALTPGEAVYLPLAHVDLAQPQLPYAEVLARLKPWLESDRVRKTGQNIKYDMHVFANSGIQLQGIGDDTMLQSYVLESHLQHDMDSLAWRHLDLKTIPYTDICGKGAKQIGFDQVAVETAAEYAAEDADVTLRLQQCLTAKLSQTGDLEQVYREIEMPVLPVLYAMERTGVLIDPTVLRQQSGELEQCLRVLERQAFELAGKEFNLGSPKQLGEILFQDLKLPVIKKTATGQPSTDEEVLQNLAEDYPLPRLLLEYRGFAKLKNTYTDKLPRMINTATGRVHTSFSQTTAVTGRLASTEPNLQNIPVRTPEGRRIRAAFIAAPGCKIVSADYSQIELRIMAHLSGDERLQQAFAAGEDVHRATAAEVFGVSAAEVSSEQRRYAKIINFGLIYGMSAHGLAKNLEIDRSAAQIWIERYFQRYPGVAAYMEHTRQQAMERGYVETIFGRRLYLPDLNLRQAGRRQGALRAAINAPMQGTAADLIKKAMVAVADWIVRQNLQTRLVLQVHDELVLEVPERELATVREKLPLLMSGVAHLSVPLVVDVGSGDNWDQAH